MVATIDVGAFTDPASGEALFACAHPIFWAPFMLVGYGGCRPLPMSPSGHKETLAEAACDVRFGALTGPKSQGF